MVDAEFVENVGGVLQCFEIRLATDDHACHWVAQESCSMPSPAKFTFAERARGSGRVIGGEEFRIKGRAPNLDAAARQATGILIV